MNKTKEYRNASNQYHREDGPAVEDANVDKRWRNSDGQLHREDGPAIEYTDGSKQWWINGELHREDGPAIEWADGTKHWYINGKLHREDGPSYEGSSNGYKEWWINDEKIAEEEFEGLELIQEILNDIGINMSKMDLVSNMRASINKTTLTILNTEINLYDPNSLNQIKEIIESTRDYK